MRRLGNRQGKHPAGSRGSDLEGERSERQWKSHNYMHLMEQPTIFYAVVLALALMDFDSGINLGWPGPMSCFGSPTALCRRRSMSSATDSSFSQRQAFASSA
jgi:hypothetical protein